MSYILCCIEGKNYSQSVCDYAVLISNNMKLPLKFLNIIEHSSKSDKLDLSGNIKLGEKDDILEELTLEEASRSKCVIKEGKEILISLKEKALSSCENEISTLQVHGEVLENILELQNEISVLIIGIKSHKNHKIGKNIKEIVREIHKPVLVVNSDFRIPKKILIAYNGTDESKKLLKSISINPIFKNVTRDIVNINEDKLLSDKFLKEAKEIFKKENIDVNTSMLNAEPKKAILDYLEQNDFDILAMGAFGHSRIKEFFFGSFTSDILAEVKKPILFFK